MREFLNDFFGSWFRFKDLILIFQLFQVFCIFDFYYHHIFTFNHPFNETYSVRGLVLLSLLLAAPIIMKILLIYDEKKNGKVKKILVIRKFLFFGYGKIAVIGFVAQSWMLLNLDKEVTYHLFLTLSCTLLSFTYYALFVLPYFADYKMKNGVKRDAALTRLGVLMVYAGAMSQTTFYQVIRPELDPAIKLLLLSSGLFYSPYTAELVVILLNWVVMQDDTELPETWLTNWLISTRVLCWEPNEVMPQAERQFDNVRESEDFYKWPIVSVIKIKEDTPDSCAICALDYDSTTVIPRTLECGHTVCEECKGKLTTFEIVKFKQCPFCMQWVHSFQREAMA
ncbi:hypothetical protein GCK72_011356 [Caenorhabditis remanei]|uniref:RING-type domain-containing protein n=1 Tax=Caenorhabditis remanei TaxID=31234 RepID=A0A6A5H8A3_CAERE|nr:hypothetical protein GCK72_011356 [Caenorhabditis remanei]KAF1763091.1 hypothetical protein GCK72_011356 [Caenorhabditis remanei]